MTQDNAQDLPDLLKLVEQEGIDRFYFSHLNYAGRGNKNRKDDAQHQLTRWAMDLLFATCLDYQQRGLYKEFTRISGRCGECRHFDICNGNTRVRAQQLTGDAWAEDPGCYLTDEEIGVSPGRAPIPVTPHIKLRSV
jgi:radical SAM protein with 4Fe4S-binding SPASM domain